jgi:hypothetical protein
MAKPVRVACFVGRDPSSPSFRSSTSARRDVTAHLADAITEDIITLLARTARSPW